MSQVDELLVLRLALLGVIFLFVAIAAFSMRAGVRGASRVNPSTAGDAPPVPSARVVVLSTGDTGLSPGAQFAVGGELTIGRAPDNGIVLPDASVSSHHAVIVRGRDGWRLRDLGSTNGTMVNERPVDGRGVTLRGGERLRLGAVVLEFHG